VGGVLVVLILVHCFAIWGVSCWWEGKAGGDQGKNGEKKQTKTNKKPQKICIPVGEADADKREKNNRKIGQVRSGGQPGNWK
jgi:hypothetical protein